MSLNFHLTGSVDIRRTQDLYEESENTLKMIVLGSKNTRLLDVRKGLGISRYIFENRPDVSVIRSEIKNKVMIACPSLRILDITINKDPQDQQATSINIKWTLPEIDAGMVKNTYLDIQNVT